MEKTLPIRVFTEFAKTARADKPWPYNSVGIDPNLCGMLVCGDGQAYLSWQRANAPQPSQYLSTLPQLVQVNSDILYLAAKKGKEAPEGFSAAGIEKWVIQGETRPWISPAALEESHGGFETVSLINGAAIKRAVELVVKLGEATVDDGEDIVLSVSRDGQYLKLSRGTMSAYLQRRLP